MKTKLNIILTILITSIIFIGVGVYASGYLASDITYKKDGKENINTVEDALNDLYKNVENDNYGDLEFLKLTSNNSYGDITSDSVLYSHDVYHVFDKNFDPLYGKFLNNNVNSSWIIWHLPTPAKIFYMKIYGSDFPERTPKEVYLYGSDDGINYDLLGNVSIGILDANNYEILKIDNSKRRFYTYYKWDFPSGNNGGSFGIAVGEIVLTGIYKK